MSPERERHNYKLCSFDLSMHVYMPIYRLVCGTGSLESSLLHTSDSVWNIEMQANALKCFENSNFDPSFPLKIRFLMNQTEFRDERSP